MNKLFGLFLLALACWTPDLAQAATRFAVCTTTCTWDNTSQAMWSNTSGGATSCGANCTPPTSSDDVTLDAATCVGGTTCTITTFNGTIAFNSLSMGACTASTTGCILDASVNNTNFTTGSVNASGTGTRTLRLGGGTWTLNTSSASWFIQTTTNLTFNANSSTIAYTGTASGSPRAFTGGSLTYNIITINSATNIAFRFTQAATIGTLTISAPNRILIGAGTTLTVTTLTNVSGSSSNNFGFLSSDFNSGTATISSANNWTCDWCAVGYMVFSGGGTFAATNSLNLGNSTNIAITPPAPTGGGRGIIGG